MKQVADLAGQIRGLGHGFVRTGGSRIWPAAVVGFGGAMRSFGVGLLAAGEVSAEGVVGRGLGARRSLLYLYIYPHFFELLVGLGFSLSVAQLA